MYQQLWGYKVEEKLYLVVREQKRLNTTDLAKSSSLAQMQPVSANDFSTSKWTFSKVLCHNSYETTIELMLLNDFVRTTTQTSPLTRQ
jgi:hypothetical protein